MDMNVDVTMPWDSCEIPSCIAEFNVNVHGEQTHRKTMKYEAQRTFEKGNIPFRANILSLECRAPKT
jgi:hypothetical protein